MLQAWSPYQDCQRSFHKLEKVEINHEWRVYWVACVALLRAIGHVLNSVDSKTSKLHKKIISDHWDSLRSSRDDNRIFWDFIQQERNNVLKNYQFGPEFIQNAFVVQTVDEEQVVHDDDGSLFTQDILLMDWEHIEDDECPFKNLDGRDLVKEALDWWSQQLQAIEKQLVTSNEGT